MSAETAEMLDKLASNVKKMRDKQEEDGTTLAECKQYIENAQNDPDTVKADTLVEEINKAQAVAKKETDELLERIKNIELHAATTGGKDKKDTRKGIRQFVGAMVKNQWRTYVEKNQDEALGILRNIGSRIKELNITDVPEGFGKFADAVGVAIETKATADLLRSDIGEFGGFLCPKEWADMLLEQIQEFSPVRAFANTRSIQSKSVEVPILQGILRAYRQGEAEEATDSAATFTTEEITPYALSVNVPMTRDQLMNNAYQIESKIRRMAGQAFAIKEGTECVIGNGVKQGLGFTVSPNVPLYSTTTNTLTFDDTIKVSGEMKSGYNPMYFFNRRTLAYLRLLKDTANGRYLWNIDGNAAPGAMPVINGYRYSSEFIDMDDPDVDDGFPILFADFNQFYEVTDRTDIVIVRDEVTKKKERIIEIMMTKWNTMQPVMYEAGILVKKIA